MNRLTLGLLLIAVLAATSITLQLKVLEEANKYEALLEKYPGIEDGGIVRAECFIDTVYVVPDTAQGRAITKEEALSRVKQLKSLFTGQMPTIIVP